MIEESVYPALGKDDAYAVPTCDGSYTLYSHSFGTTYHSIYGAVSESRHTYIQKCLNTQSHCREIRILEFGFGTGLNAFLAYLYSQKHQKQMAYTGIESHRLEWDVVKQLDYPGYLAHADQENVLQEMHTSNSFHVPYFDFDLIKDLDLTLSPGSFDCIFFDAFAPDVQPELWNSEMFEQLFKVTSPGGCLVSYCSKGDVRRSLLHAGFKVERIPGAPGKRQMLQAFRPS
ncbi:MAG: tRNA (5-methylaminomethyl-2-thiouridine)(34)-methyltransferase MnmD [Saprospiraceae bacterium]